MHSHRQRGGRAILLRLRDMLQGGMTSRDGALRPFRASRDRLRALTLAPFAGDGRGQTRPAPRALHLPPGELAHVLRLWLGDDAQAGHRYPFDAGDLCGRYWCRPWMRHCGHRS